MYAADSDAWRAIEQGERQIDWLSWFGHPGGADHLTDQGKAVTLRAAADLTRFLGPSWLHRAMQPGTSHTVRELGARSPVFAASPERAAEAYIESIRWWASIQVLVDMQTDGITAVRRAVHNDVTTQRFAHTVVQTRLAAMGASLGVDVVLEPTKVSGPGDLLLRTNDCEVFVEIATLGPDQAGEQDEIAVHRHFEQLLGVARAEMYWVGKIPGFLNRTDEQAWRSAISDAAERCMQSQTAVFVNGPWGELVAQPGRAPAGSELIGPEPGADAGNRLADLLTKKAFQTRDSGAAWVWVEDRGGIHVTTPFARMDLLEKLRVLAALVKPVLDNNMHLGGMAWSAVVGRSPLTPDDQLVDAFGIAFRRGLPIQHARETVIVNGRLLMPYQTGILSRMCDREADWLDWALTRLGEPPVGQLVAVPTTSA